MYSNMVENGSPNNPTMQAFGKMEFLMVTTSKKVAAYIYHINQEMPDAAGGAAPQGTKANWENKIKNYICYKRKYEKLVFIINNIQNG